MDQEKIVQTMMEKGSELWRAPFQKVPFTKNDAADGLLNDLDHFPHAFVLGCIMDRQVKAERAWLIPYHVSEEIGGFEFDQLLRLKEDSLKDIFARRRLHRFNDVMAALFYSAIRHIRERYDKNASNIWNDEPRSAALVRRFLEFEGAGVKIATMAANLLVRDMKIPTKDKICIDISPDVHVKRVFRRTGLTRADADEEELTYRARELNPDYPGVFDLSAWEIGRQWCRPRKRDCPSCYLERYCPKMQ